MRSRLASSAFQLIRRIEFFCRDKRINLEIVSAKPIVIKFGGTSVGDTRAFERVREIVRAREAERPVVIVSAMSRVTDALLASVQMAAEDGAPDAAAGALDQHFERHARVAHDLLGPRVTTGEIETAIERARGEVLDLLRQLAARMMPRPLLQDVIVSYGERLSATLLAAVLRAGGVPAHYVDARRCIVTDENYGSAAPLIEETGRRTRAEIEPLIEQQKVPVLGGFIGASPDGATTTLGRGGSDYSAALVGAALSAREIQIWTDVSGVLTADPRLVPTARPVPQLSYAEAAELAYFGAKVLHPKTIQPAVEQGIPVRICNTFAPTEAGTLICARTATSPQTIKSIAHKTGITIVRVTSARMLGEYGFLRALFEIFERHHTVVDVVTTSEVSVSLSLDDAGSLPAVIRDLRKIGAVKVEQNRAIICLFGEELGNTPGVAAIVFSAIHDINISLISLGASSVNLTFMIDEGRAAEAVARLHEAFFSSSRAPAGKVKVASSSADRSL